MTRAGWVIQYRGRIMCHTIRVVLGGTFFFFFCYIYIYDTVPDGENFSDAQFHVIDLRQEQKRDAQVQCGTVHVDRADRQDEFGNFRIHF